jgi:hypothetical protein
LFVFVNQPGEEDFHGPMRLNKLMDAINRIPAVLHAFPVFGASIWGIPRNQGAVTDLDWRCERE